MGAGYTLTASLFYSGQSGRPWAAVFNGDYNGDTGFTNDLLYIPASASEVTFTNGTFSDFQQFINNMSCLSDFSGRSHERNACRSPWSNTMDFRLNFGLPFKRVKAEITWDILNLINLFDSQKGLFRYANFNDLLVGVPTFPAGAPPNYNIANIFDANRELLTPEDLYLRDDLRSRWQMQLGGRIRF
jgi:hypothetical protein